MSDLQVYISQNTILNNSKIIVFSVFGEIIEIDIEIGTFATKGNFAINHGITNSQIRTLTIIAMLFFIILEL